MIEVNSLHTPLTDQLVESLDIEIRAELFDIIDTILFVNRLISPNRLRAKDRPRDLEGRIVVDISNPHILENMDYFRQAALHYQKFGNYTPLHPSSIPTSEYVKFWKEEARRCREGLVREYDGEWIPGMFYFYLNYTPILKSKIKVGRKRAERVQDFPDMYDGDYLYFHYINQARENGQHAMILKRRGSGCSFKAAASLARLFILGDSDISKEMVRGFALANEKEYLIRDGVLNKFVDHIDWVAKTTPWPRIRLKDSLNEMHWKMGFKERDTNTESGTENEIIGVSLMNDPDRARGKRCAYIFWEEVGKFGQVLKAWQVSRPSVEEGDFAHGTMVAYGTGGAEGADFKGAEEFFYKSAGYNIYSIPNVFDRNINGTANSGFFFPAYLNRLDCYDKDGNSDVIKTLIKVLTKRLEVKYQTSDSNALVQEKAENPITPQEAVLRKEGSMFPILDLKDYLAEISPNLTKFTQLHYTGHFKLDSSGNVEWSNLQDHPVIREYPVKEDTDKVGCVELFEMPKRDNEGKVPWGRYVAGCLPAGERVITTQGLVNIEDVTLDDKLINKDGKVVNINTLMEFDVIGETLYTLKMGNTFSTTTFTGEHPLYVSNNIWGYHNTNVVRNTGFPQKYKKFNFSFKEVKDAEVGQWISFPNIYKNLQNNFDIDDLWDNSKYRIDRWVDSPLKKKDFWWFIGLWLGDGYCVGDSSVALSFNRNEIDYINRFKNIVKVLFNRSCYERFRGGGVEISFHFKQLNKFLNKYFGKYANGKFISEWVKKISEEFKYELVSGYLASDGCIGKNTKKYWYTEFVSINLGLLEGFQDILFSLGLISSIRRLRFAKEHIIEGKRSKVVETYRLSLSHHDTLCLAKVLYNSDKIKIRRISEDDIKVFSRRRFSVDCQLSDDINYIYFKIKDIKKSLYSGRVFNFECDTNTYVCNHITTHNCDPIDYDSPYGTGSLGSIFVFDLWTDRIVAEYSGRPQRATDFYETCLRLLKFYNAEANYENNLKGLFAYFDQNHALHYLCDSPQILRDMDFVKGESLFGNKSKGVSASKGINSWSRKLQADWMITDAYSVGGDNEEKDENGKVIEVKKKKNLHTIGSIGYLKEAISWNIDTNADRISAMGMVMILREDRLKYEKDRKDTHANTIFEDKWFKRTYQKVGPGYNRLLLPKQKKHFDYY